MSNCLLRCAQVAIGDGDALVVLPADTVRYWLARMSILDCRTWGQLRTTVTSLARPIKLGFPLREDPRVGTLIRE